MIRFITWAITLPFTLLYYLFVLVSWRNNYYIIAKNTTNCYNILKSQSNNDDIFNEKDIFYLSGVADAYSYIVRNQISLDDIYNIAQMSDNLEDFLFDFVKILLVIDTGYEAVARWYSSYENREYYKKQIKKWINKSERHNERYAQLINQILEIEEVMKYIDTELNDYLDDIIENR